MTYTPTPEAIEAVARALFERDNSEPWEEAAPSIKDEFYADAIAALTAAYPFIAAQAKGEALREAIQAIEDACPSNADCWCEAADLLRARAATIEGKSE